MNLNIKTSPEDLFQVIFKNLDDLIIIINSDWKIEFINKSVLKKKLGYSKEDLIGYNINKLFHPEERIEITKTIKSLINNKNVNLEVRIKDKKGKWHWFDVYGERISYKNNCSKAIFILKDITQNKEKLKEAEKKYRLITENAYDLISIFNEQLRFTYINEKTHKRILGYKKEDMIGKPLWKFIHPDDFQRAYKIIKSRLKKGLGRAEIRFKKKDGAYIWLETVGVAFETKDNKRIGVTISRDYSERKKFEELIQEENKKLKKLNKMRNNLINRVSHELKTPMTSVYGSIQLIEEICRKKLNNEGLEMISIAKRGCERLQNLIENILDVSIIDASKLKINKEKINFGKIVRNCINELKYLIEKKQLLFEINIIDNIKVFVDKLRIEEVIINLISNAIKNTPPNGKISISLVKSNNKAKFTIKDNGIGIGKEEIETLFTKFGKIERKQYQENINMEGSGLGLYISRKIIEEHNGEIWAESEGTNKGSSFFFTLPLI